MENSTNNIQAIKTEKQEIKNINSSTSDVTSYENVVTLNDDYDVEKILDKKKVKNVWKYKVKCL